MKNMTWRRIALILSVVTAGIIAFGAGYAMGAVDTARRIITIAVEVLEIKDVSAVELLTQYLKLKGGG